MAVENYGFVPQDEPPKPGNQETRLPEMSEETKKYYKDLEAKNRAERERIKLQNKKDTRWLAGFLAIGLAAGYGIYKQEEYGDKIKKEALKNEPSNVFWSNLEKSSRLSAQRKAELQKRMAAITEKMGKNIFDHINEGVEMSGKPVSKKPEFSGFENFGISNSDVEPLFAPDLYPSGTINGNIGKVSYKDIFRDMKIFDDAGQPMGAGGEVLNSGFEIAFYRFKPVADEESNLKFIKYFGFIAGHESSHKRDWASDYHLTPEQRLDFLFEAFDVFLNSNRYNSHTDVMDVENERIEKGYTDKQKGLKLFVKLTEWWADMCSEALEYPEDFFNEASPKEVALVKKWFVRDDKKFDFYKVKVLREQRQNKLTMVYQNNLAQRKIKNHALPNKPGNNPGRR